MNREEWLSITAAPEEVTMEKLIEAVTYSRGKYLRGRIVRQVYKEAAAVGSIDEVIGILYGALNDDYAHVAEGYNFGFSEIGIYLVKNDILQLKKGKGELKETIDLDRIGQMSHDDTRVIE